MSVIRQRQDESILDLHHQPEDTLPEHLVRMPGERWCLWRWVGLRSAGFQADGIHKLAAPGCGAAADEVVRVEQNAEQAWLEAIEALEDEIAKSEGAQRAGLTTVLKSLKEGNVPKRVSAGPAASRLIQDFEVACAQVIPAWEQYDSVFKESQMRVSDSIREIARSERFREALTWQNRKALHGSLDSLLRTQPGETSGGAERRRREGLIANYWQRYLVKNDTIGFFGPVGWARFVTQGEPLSVRPGPSLLADRKLYFEVWCIDKFAEVLAQDEAMRRWIAPRRMPFIRADDQGFHVPQEIHYTPAAEDLAILQRCDGKRTAKEIAQELIPHTSLALDGEDAVYARLARLHDDGIVSWTFHVPPNARSEISLRRKLEEIGEEALRDKALAALDELENGRAEVAAAAGDARWLNEAIQELEATFTRLTGAASTRNEGKTYAGRTLLYEDCRRDVSVEIGPQVIKEAGPALSLLLMSARWLTHKLGEQYRGALAELYQRMARESGSAIVEAIDLWARIQSAEFSSEGPLVAPYLSTFSKRWSEILSIPEGGRRVSYSSEELRPRVTETFDAPRPGWQGAHYHSPDLMIAASSVEDICQGDYQLVLGEIHVARNTLSYSLFLEQHPRVEELFKAVDLDLPRPRLLPVPPRDMADSTSRFFVELVSPKDYRLEFSRGAPAWEGSEVVSIGELVIEERGGGLIVRTRDGRLQLDPGDAFGNTLAGYVMNSFKLLAPDYYTPRVSIDRLVVHRETWRFPTSELGFAFEKDEACRFLEARRWSTSHHMPRYIFIKTPVEMKPFFVDLDSPVLVNLFAKMVRQASEKALPEELISVTEMLPRPDQAWLPDAAGNRYTSELRIVAVDLKV